MEAAVDPPSEPESAKGTTASDRAAEGRSETTGARPVMTTGRLEAFSDGVFAIAATLLILSVHATGSSLGPAVLHAWPSYAGYAVSFLSIGVMWVNHHVVMHQIARVDRRLLILRLIRLPRRSLLPPFGVEGRSRHRSQRGRSDRGRA